MSRWFVEERRFDGSWSPVVYHGDKPGEKRGESRRVTFRAEPVEIPAYFEHLTLDQLAEALGVDGRFTRTTAQEMTRPGEVIHDC